MMKVLFFTGAMACLAVAATAENQIQVVQIGVGNMQSTLQSGSNTATVIQAGTENNVSLVQNGSDNAAGIAQVGADHTRTVVQDGDRLGYGSIQASSHLTGSFSQTGGNMFTSTTAELDAQ
jgi:hypothetical protein